MLLTRTAVNAYERERVQITCGIVAPHACREDRFQQVNLITIFTQLAKASWEKINDKQAARQFKQQINPSNNFSSGLPATLGQSWSVYIPSPRPATTETPRMSETDRRTNKSRRAVTAIIF